MNWFWRNTKVWIYNLKELREHLWLDYDTFNNLMELEVERYKNMIQKNYWKAYYQSKLKENPHIAKTWGTPTFRPHPEKTYSFIYNEESWIFLEKTWSRNNKYNIWKNLPFNFVFKW